MKRRIDSPSPHHRERGASATEYGLIVAVFFVVVMGAIQFTGDALDGVYTTMHDVLTNAFS